MVAGGAGAAAWSGWLDLASPYRATHAARCVAAHPSYGAAHGATFRGVRWTRLVALPISTSLCLRAAYAENIVAAGRSLGAANVATSRLAWCTSRSAYSLPTCFSLRAANNAARWVARVALITAVSIPTSFSRPALLTAAAAVVFVFPKVLTGPAGSTPHVSHRTRGNHHNARPYLCCGICKFLVRQCNTLVFGRTLCRTTHSSPPRTYPYICRCNTSAKTRNRATCCMAPQCQSLLPLVVQMERVDRIGRPLPTFPTAGGARPRRLRRL